MYQVHLLVTGRQSTQMMRRGAAEMNLMIVWTIFAMMTLVALCWPQARRQRNLRRIGLLTKKPGLAG